jgi:hypothetical protein
MTLAMVDLEPEYVTFSVAFIMTYPTDNEKSIPDLSSVNTAHSDSASYWPDGTANTPFEVCNVLFDSNTLGYSRGIWNETSSKRLQLYVAVSVKHEMKSAIDPLLL